jgi:hypothetical protein
MLAKKNEEKNNSYRITIENNRYPQLVILLPTLGSNAPPLSPPPPHTHLRKKERGNESEEEEGKKKKIPS